MDSGREADRLFAELVARGDGVTDESVRALCDGRPELAEEFRRLYEDWRRLLPFFERLDAERAVQAAVRASLAATRPDPARPGAESGDPLVDEIVRRLLERGPAASRYRIDEEFARGGMGRIRRVFDQDLRRNLAMKVILEELDLRDSSTRRSDADERRLARFLEEAQIAGQLDHPGIAPVHELGLDAEGRLYFTMKLVKGRTLLETYDLVRTGEGGWSVTRAVAALQKVCEAMAYAHEKGVLHRDLKPSNVMVGRFGEVYVMDWGLARVLGRTDRKDIRLRERNDPPPSVVETERHTRKGGRPDSPLYTMDGDVVGTPAYMSPEQARGDLDDVGPQTDVYGVGAMLYHLLAERMPYASPDAPADAYEVLDRLRAGPPRPLHTVAPGTVPAELLSICEKAMARRRADRYATMTELADDLRAYLEDRVVRAHRTGPFAELSKWYARNRPLAASLAALVVAVVGGALLFAWSEKGKRISLAAAQTERVAKTRLADIMTARHLGQDFDDHTPDEDGIRHMELWLARFDEIAGRADLHAASAMEFPPDSTDRAEIEEMLVTIERLEARRADVSRTLDVATSLRTRTVADHADDWALAIAGIRSSPHYGGIEIDPQVGLVPLGVNDQGLWEFSAPMSGERPRGGRVTREEDGLVLVLIPGGSFVMGSLPDSPNRDHDEFAHSRFVEPFFLSKFETTQAQYARVVGENPAQYPPGTVRLDVEVGPLHPIENVDWFAATAYCRRLGLRLPTEPEWEYAAKAGEENLFHWSDAPTDLEGRENVGDAATAELASQAAQSFVGYANWSDGFPLHAPVGSFAATRFGCFDVLGNVSEWTSSRYERGYGQAAAPIRSTAADHRRRVARGGNYMVGPAYARIPQRQPCDAQQASFMIGLRPARSLQ